MRITALQNTSRFLLLCFLVFAPFQLFAFEYTGSEVITVDTTWTKAESPYVFTNNAHIEFTSNTTLTIEPGVVMKFDDSTDLEILGNLHAVGTESEPITFTSIKDDSIAGDTNGDGSLTFPSRTDRWDVESGEWRVDSDNSVDMSFVEFRYMDRGFVISNADSRLDNMHFATSTNGLYTLFGTVDLQNFSAKNIYRTALTFDTVDATAVDVSISEILGDAIEMYQSTVSLDDITLLDVRRTGIGVYIDSIADITNFNSNHISSFTGNVVSVFDSDVTMGGIDIFSFSDNEAISIFNAHATITDAVLIGGLDYAIYADSSRYDDVTSLHLENVHIQDFLGAGIEMYSGVLSIKDSVIKDNFIGIASYFGSVDESFIMEGSSITGNALYGSIDYGSLTAPNVQKNWWGDPTGPYHEINNPTGLGDVIEGDVDFSNWLTAPPGEPPVSDIDPLLLEYMPVLYMHPDEDYFPMNVEAFVEGSAIWDDRGILTDKELVIAGAGNEATLEYIATTTDTSDWYIQFSGNGAKEFDLEGAGTRYKELTRSGAATTTVYVYKMEDSFTDDQGVENEFIVLQYWYFYAMNNWKEAMEDFDEYEGVNNHEGDWESIFIYLNKNTQEPKYVGYSAHHNDGNPSNPLQYDSVRRSWNSTDMSFDTGKVVSFVALGSHANYSNNVNNGVHNAKAGIDLTSDASLILNEDSIQKTKLPVTEVDNWFNLYQGKWGADGIFLGTDGPQGPNFTDVSGIIRFHNPVEWAGLDKVTDLIISSPTSTFSFASSTVGMLFSSALEAGTELSVSVHDEFISFGENVSNINFLPQFWDFGTSLVNGSFDVSVSLAYTQEQLVLWGVDEEFMQVYFYNEVDNGWQPVQSRIDTILNTITFDTTHFSRYAIGSPVLSPVDESIVVKSHLGAYEQATDTREALVSLHNKGTTTLSGTIRVVVSELTEEGVLLLDASGVTTEGNQYVDLAVDPLDAKKKILLPALHFALPTEINASPKANEKAQKENAVFKQFEFDVEIFSFGV